MLGTEQVERFWRDGFLKGGQVLTPQEVGELQEEMERVIRDVGKKDVPQPVRCVNLNQREPAAPVWQIVNIWQASEPFKRLVFNPVVAGEVAQLLDARELRLWHDQIQYKPSTAGGVNMWHQD